MELAWESVRAFEFAATRCQFHNLSKGFLRKIFLLDITPLFVLTEIARLLATLESSFRNKPSTLVTQKYIELLVLEPIYVLSISNQSSQKRYTKTNNNHYHTVYFKNKMTSIKLGNLIDN